MPDPNAYGLDFVNHPSIKNINHFMSSRDHSEFIFEYVNPSVVSDIVLSLSSSKAMGNDNIPIRLVKDSISIIARPLSNLFNYSISMNYYPIVGNIARFTLFFKSAINFLNFIIKLLPILLPLNTFFKRIFPSQFITFFFC